MIAVADAIQNLMTGSKTSRDKTAYNQWVDIPPLDVETLETLYAQSHLARVVVDRIVDESLREGFQLARRNSTPAADADEAKQLMDEWTRLQEDEARFARAAKWGRLMGGGLILGVNGSGSLASQLDDTKVTAVEFIKDVDRQTLRAVKWRTDGRPLVYEYQPVMFGDKPSLPVQVHASRVILFPGASTTAKRRQMNEGWDLSVLQDIYETLTAYESMWGNIDSQLADTSQAVITLHGLIQSLAEDGGKDDVRTRLALMDMTRSVSKALVLDAGDEAGVGKETFQVVERALGGLGDVIRQYYTRIASNADQPETILLGTAPGGDSATGELERSMWFGRVDAYRRNVEQPRIERIVRMLARSLNLADPEEWEVVWPELEKMSPMDMATKNKMAVDSVVSLANAQVLLPEEIALSLGRLAPDLHVTVDTDSRVRALELGLEEVANREMGLGMVESTAEIEAEYAPKPAPAANGGKRTPPKASKRKAAASASEGRHQGG